MEEENEKNKLRYDDIIFFHFDISVHLFSSASNFIKCFNIAHNDDVQIVREKVFFSVPMFFLSIFK